MENNQIKIKSCHRNPIFFTKGSQSKAILEQNAEIILNDNDFFSLLPDSAEFKVKIDVEGNDNQTPFRVRQITEINDNLVAGDMAVTLSQVLRDENAPQQEVTSSSSRPGSPQKRPNDGESEAEPPKKIKIEPQDDSGTSAQSNSAPASADSSNQQGAESTNPQSSTTTTVKQEPDSSNVKTENSSAPTAQNDRPSCDHGIRCFRNNPGHRRDFAHPGDDDYRRPTFAPAAPNAPRCPYWEGCYRRNPDHFRMFQHPPSSECNKI